MLPVAILAAVILAQAQPQFEVASVKPNKSGDQNWTLNYGDGKFTGVNARLRDYVRWAYEVKDYQVRGPGWIDSARFDIIAKASSANVKDEEVLRMLKPLLAERFKMKAHHETKSLPVYRLVVAKGGARLHQTDAQQERDSFHDGEIKGEGMWLARLADLLSVRLDRPVIDGTGVKGRFDIDLKFAPDNDPESPLPSLFTAVQEQLGLRLESAKGPVDVLVVDYVEQPEPN